MKTFRTGLALLGARVTRDLVEIEQEVSLRLLRHLASSVRHQQYYDTDRDRPRGKSPHLPTWPAKLRALSLFVNAAFHTRCNVTETSGFPPRHQPLLPIT